MPTVYRPTVTKPLPPNAEVYVRKGETTARWKDARGRTRTAKVTTTPKGERIVIESSRYVAKYRDGSGIVRKVATGCRDETAARAVLAERVRRSELVKSGVMTVDEDATADYRPTPIAENIDAYLVHLEAKGASAEHRANVDRQLRRIAADCEFERLGDVDRAAMERWLVDRAAEDMSARTRNSYLAALIAFSNWAVKERRLVSNPLRGIGRADEKAGRRRQRRSLTEAELVKLLDVASRRPLLDAAMVRRGKRKGQAVAKLHDDTRLRLEALGRERALIYKTLVLTGLRKGELASLTVGQLHLDGRTAYAVLDAGDEKNRRGSDIVVRADLAKDLRQWLSDKLQSLQGEVRR
jgi:site-specific recombinase XerC